MQYYNIAKINEIWAYTKCVCGEWIWEQKKLTESA